MALQRRAARTRGLTFVGALVMLLLVGLVGPAEARHGEHDPWGDHEHRYTATGARFWTWALTQPWSSNPLLDPDGRSCAEGQRGRTWFLAGAPSAEPIVRSCTVPRGKRLVVPVFNNIAAALPGDLPEQSTPDYLRSLLAWVEDDIVYEVTVDGLTPRRSRIRYKESEVFSFVLPADNILGQAEGTVVGPAVDAGYYLHLKRLRRGQHTIEIRATSAETGEVRQDLTWNILVRGRHHRPEW